MNEALWKRIADSTRYSKLKREYATLVEHINGLNSKAAQMEKELLRLKKRCEVNWE